MGGILLVAVAIIGSTGSANLNQSKSAGQQEQEPDRRQSVTQLDIEKDETERFFDQLVPDLMQQHHIPGAVFAVVRDGQPLLVRGYGYSNLEEQLPVNPETTLFRIASVTKLFTWTAVMQLVERGQLELDTDINHYLTDFQIPDGGYPEPVTLADLMSHTAGFEDRGLIGTLARTPEEVLPLHQYLDDRMPKRVRPPGSVSAYSNYGGALAGHIVAQVSGMSYEQYVRENIFVPLGIKHATVSRTPPGDHLASSYQWRERAYYPDDEFFVIPKPEGGINASATSIARFMISHLDDGQIEGSAILRAETVQQMHRQSFTHHPRLSGWAHGFQEYRENGHRILGHGGRIGNFTNSLILIPSERLGLFMSFNSNGGSAASRELKKQFLDKFLPVEADDVILPALATANFSDLSGYYAPCRSSQTTMAKLGMLMQASRVESAQDDSFLFLGRRWVPCGQELLRSITGDELLATRRSDGGRVEYLFFDTSAWQRLAWYETPAFHAALAGSCLVVFLLVVVSRPIGFFRSRCIAANHESNPRFSIVARHTAFMCATINLVFAAALVMIMSGDLSALEFGIPFSLKLLLVLPIVSTVLAVSMLVCSVTSWKRNWWSQISRACYLAVTLAALAFVWFLGFWNLLGWWF